MHPMLLLKPVSDESDLFSTVASTIDTIEMYTLLKKFNSPFHWAMQEPNLDGWRYGLQFHP